MDVVSLSTNVLEANESDTAISIEITLQRPVHSDNPVSVRVKTRDLQDSNAAKCKTPEYNYSFPVCCMGKV